MPKVLGVKKPVLELYGVPVNPLETHVPAPVAWIGE